MAGTHCRNAISAPRTSSHIALWFSGWHPTERAAQVVDASFAGNGKMMLVWCRRTGSVEVVVSYGGWHHVKSVVIGDRNLWLKAIERKDSL
jgi:hypothetical protein